MYKLPWTLLLLIIAILAPTNGNLTEKVPKNQLSLSDILEYNTILFPLTTVSKAELVGEQCHARLQELRRGILQREFWALKVLDASGKQPPAFMLGDNMWLGSAQLCEAAQNGLNLDISRYVAHKMNMSLLTDKTPFDVDYRVIYAAHNSSYQTDVVYGQARQLLHIGLCVPSECNSQQLMQLVTAYFESEIFLSGDLHAIKPSLLKVKTMEFKGGDFHKMIAFKLVVVFVTYTLLMTLYAYYLRTRRLPSTNVQVKPSSFEAFVLCYDLQLNCSKILAPPDSASNTFAFLNGGRMESALIATFFHTFIMLKAIVSNPTQLFTYVSSIGNMEVAMDVFLLISGFLQTYSYLRNRSQLETIRRLNFSRSVLEIVKLTFHRFLRLAPLYYFMICITYLAMKYNDSTTVFNLSGFVTENCERYWWRNVLFIHNLYDHKDMCLAWTWFVSLEMQYTITLTVLLVVYAKHPKYAKISLLLLMIASLAYQTIVGIQVNFQISLETTFANFTKIYANPLARIFPYLGGALTCWLYLEYNAQLQSCKLLTNTIYSLLIHLVFVICSQFAPLGRGYSVRVETFIFVLHRCLYTLTAGWSIIAAANNRLAWHGRFLSAKIFQKTIHVSYALSLLNPFVIICLFTAGSKLVFVEPIRMFVLFIGLIIILHILSFPLTVLFEMPYRNISSLLTKRGPAKRAKSS
ncbi:O-acyltransferase like protein-like isoform X1 [Bactrocera dorsalis]|uniref:O-acyltransferase like protein-like isoform X1 n=1 Tax=Bactrocera dorsalis TaxID=27457 RepID=A0ABM3J3U6_BACDO|nr:O-acyltransferase like protein-like isoform X1 [Bactrocera dorsalis]